MMASLSLSTLPITATTKKPNTCSRSPLFSKPSPRHFKVSCNVADDDHKTSETPKLILPKTSLEMQNVDRRNLLLGLGGIYGATNLASVQSALAFPVTAPDNIQNCYDAINVADPKHSLRGVKCCPKPPVPYYKPEDYDFPRFDEIRVRPAAQRVTPEYIEKYQLAMKRMKDLNDDDPHSWNQQAKIHCAYCNDAYIQGNNQDSSYRIEIHQSSLFFPFHRWYLYFHERILGKLIGDETFALPYWNWDHPTGMMIPAMYEAKKKGDPRNNPLFDPYRNVKHLPPTTMDLNHTKEKNIDPAKLVHQNLCTMRRQMIDQAHSAKSFFGHDCSAPNPNPKPNEPAYLTKEPRPGSIENPVHNVIHRWTGNPRLPMDEDMGDFYSAGYDPIFYAHHANVDRMWTIWKDLDLKHKEPKSDDWLNASYVFYDENKKLVRVYNKDCVDTIRMGYEFEKSPIPWKDYSSIPRHKNKKKLDLAANLVRRPVERRVKDMKFPVKLDKVVKVHVKRPVKKRSNEEKEKEKEMLFLNGIKYDSRVYLKFDVLVNAFDDEIETTAADSEFAGSFAEVAHHHGKKMFKTSGAMFGITKLLEDLQAEDDADVLVSLVPRAGADDVTISEIKIELVPIDDDDVSISENEIEQVPIGDDELISVQD